MKGSVVYGWKQNLPGQVQNIFFNPVGQPSRRYWPDSGCRSEKTLKNRHFFEVFGIFDILPYTVGT